MPIYEYKCPKCGVFEAMQRITEPSLKKCPTCKSKVARQMSRGSFVLKGSGWYATDYAKKSAPSTDSSESSTNGADKSSGDSSKPSSDSKPATEAKPSSESKPSKTSSDSKGASASKSSSEKTSAKAAD
jgi:putative FmdB family regulatory protein